MIKARPLSSKSKPLLKEVGLSVKLKLLVAFKNIGRLKPNKPCRRYADGIN